VRPSWSVGLAIQALSYNGPVRKALTLLACVVPWTGAALAVDYDVITGKQVTLLGSGALGLREFPDGALAVLSVRPTMRLLVSSGVSSFLLEGSRLDSLRKAQCVLKPGKRGEFDNGYTGISGAWKAADGKLYAFYHAEDQEGMTRFDNSVPGYYGCAAAAVSVDNGRSFTKLGPVVTSAQGKDPGGRADQGCGELCVVPERGGKYLYMYYVDHSRLDGRGVQIFLARSAIVEGPPVKGSWKKYCHGVFREDGLGGMDTPVVTARDIPADATFPHVTWSGALSSYVMVFNVVAYLEHPEAGGEGRAERSGIHVAYSRDGISWSKPRQLIKAFSIPFKGRELAWHPSLVWDKEGSLAAWLVYSYTPSWGYEAPKESPHYMVGRRVKFARGAGKGR